MSTDPFGQYKNRPSHFLRGESEETSLERINARIDRSAKRNPAVPLLRWTSIAAAAVLLLFIGKVFLFQTDNTGMGVAFFEPFPNYEEPSLRGADNATEAYRHYDLKEFDLAVDMFRKMSMSRTDSLYMGISLCAAGEWGSAESVFRSLGEMAGQYESPHQWYWALSLLETDRQEEAQVLLDTLSTGNSSFAGDAVELTRALK